MSNVIEPEMFDEKDPGETIFVYFEFKKLANAITGAAVTCTRKRGSSDSNPSALLSGSASVSGTLVRQKVTGGIAKADYNLKCTATDDSGQTLVLTGILPVRDSA